MPNRSTLVLNAVIKAMQDQQVLVQRSLLDLLLTHFRLDYEYASVTVALTPFHLPLCLFSETVIIWYSRLFDNEGVTRIIHCALSVVLRREVSLSRRVYSWLLGESGDGSNESVDRAYFDKYSRKPLIAAISVRARSCGPLSFLVLTELPNGIICCLVIV
jgi:hypothetical protein